MCLQYNYSAGDLLNMTAPPGSRLFVPSLSPTARILEDSLLIHA